ncbi:FRG domain-containing protein [Nocardioides panacisoli]|uniref:FRG domain-containing protein n=1 Tax=Nocardioides panacisoli TaxID=627624 RepID=A0ABP7HR60_9ACTN
MTVKEEVVQSISDYVRLVLEDFSAARHWFRGQGCHRRLLRPSLFRRIEPYSASDMIAKELALITRFRQRSLPLWPEGYPQDDWEQLFAMQHFGVPTRLLDWSENATVAAYFAADHDATRCECEVGDCRPTIWILDPVRLNRLNSRLDGYGEAIGILSTNSEAIEPWAPGTEETRFAPWPVALHGTHNSARIVAQQGTFTVMGKEGAALETSPAVQDNDEVLAKVVFETDHSMLMTELRALGVTRPTVFPDLPSVAFDVTVEELGS